MKVKEGSMKENNRLKGVKTQKLYPFTFFYIGEISTVTERIFKI